jgi:hypothetical protein
LSSRETRGLREGIGKSIQIFDPKKVNAPALEMFTNDYCGRDKTDNLFLKSESSAVQRPRLSVKIVRDSRYPKTIPRTSPSCIDEEHANSAASTSAP